MSSHRTFVIKKRILAKGNLWGVVAECNGESYTIEVEKLLTMMVVYNIPFVVDYAHADRPATLTVIHKLNKSGMTYYFRTIGDKTKRNNLNKLSSVSYRSKLPQHVTTKLIFD